MQDGFDEDVYGEVENWRESSQFSERERLAAEYAERFALDHTNIDDDFWTRMRAAYSDGEILELSMAIGTFIGLGRTLAVLDIASECAISWAPADAPEQ